MVEQGDQIVLGLDLNEDIMQAAFSSRLSSLGLVEILSHSHGIPPATYSRGSTPIDGIYVSPGLCHCDCECGLLPFLNDHRPTWIDIPFNLIFTDPIPNMPIRARRLNLQDPRTVRQYTEGLLQLYKETKILERLQALRDRQDFDSPDYLIEFNALDLLRTQCMHKAERKCRKLRIGAVPRCPEYSVISRQVLAWQAVLRKRRGARLDSTFYRRILKTLQLSATQVASLAEADIQERLKKAFGEQKSI